MNQKQFDKPVLETQDFKRKIAIIDLLTRFTENKTIFVTSDHIGNFKNFGQFYRIIYHEYDKFIKKKRINREFPLLSDEGLYILDTANGAQINIKVIEINHYKERTNKKQYIDALIMKFTFTSIDENNQYTGIFKENESVIMKFKIEKTDKYQPVTVKENNISPTIMTELFEAIKIEKVYKTKEEIKNNDNIIEYNEHNLSLLK